MQLARGQALHRVRYNAGNIPTNLPAWERAPQTGLSVEETIEKIEEHISWMQIRRADYEPDYRALIHRCLDELAAGYPQSPQCFLPVPTGPGRAAAGGWQRV